MENAIAMKKKLTLKWTKRHSVISLVNLNPTVLCVPALLKNKQTNKQHGGQQYGHGYVKARALACSLERKAVSSCVNFGMVMVLHRFTFRLSQNIFDA